MSTANDTTVTVTFDPNATNLQADIIGPATVTHAGAMTAEQVQELDAVVAGVQVLQVYTNFTRPAANDPVLGAIPGVKVAVIWNSTDKQPNYSDGTNWYDASGNLT